ncbi:hypothetical protein CHS0354_035216 [Potamilus streckersoni]|uniref:peptidoglycan lytic exotransglycosylase n=1 Tax=Potamilus streckersoni TaxID=2493646 RepID=A0AAE0S2F9_9BIVA|nr:hypothetical protein CHS0354_035216 [Potamilus streckersoni]
MKNLVKIFAFLFITLTVFACANKKARKPAEPAVIEEKKHPAPTQPVSQEEEAPQLLEVSANQLFASDDLPLQSLKDAIAMSRRYLKKPSIQSEVFRYGEYSYNAQEVLFSYDLFEKILDGYQDKKTFLKNLNDNFLILKSPGSADNQSVLFTGYYEPVARASLKKDGLYNIPAHGLPGDLSVLSLETFRPDLVGRTIIYRNEGGNIVPYYSREEITRKNSLEGKSDVIAWFKDPVDLFFMQIQGSGIVQLPDGEMIRLGYAGSNGRPYTSIGRHLIEKGALNSEEVTMQTIRKYLAENPAEVDKILSINESYTFFTRQDMKEGPFGSLNVPLTPERSIATDALLFPKAMLGFVTTEIPDCDQSGTCKGTKPISRFVVNQDTGGAIKGFGRADIFWGRGEYAAGVAGQMKYYGDLYIIVAKKEFAGLLLLTACSPGLTYDKALSAESCAAEKGIWYAEKCWKPYDDRSVADSDVERFAEERIQALRSTKLMLNGKSYSYEQVSLDISAGEEIITVKFDSGNMQVVVNPQAATLMLLQNDTANPSGSRVLSEDTIDVKEISGALEFKGSISAANEDKSYDIAFTVSEDMLRIGTTRVWADGATAYLEGIPGIITYVQVRDILKQHPEVRKLVIREVKGGFNDPINFNTADLSAGAVFRHIYLLRL